MSALLLVLGLALVLGPVMYLLGGLAMAAYKAKQGYMLTILVVSIGIVLVTVGASMSAAERTRPVTPAVPTEPCIVSSTGLAQGDVP
jgi:hypothetical protein